MNKKKIIVATVTLILTIIAVFFRISYTDEDINKISEGIETVTNIIQDNQSTTEIPKLTQEDEQTVEVQETEAEGFEEQGNIAYEGSEKTPNISVGDYAGLTYYSQADSRWANHMYSAIEDKSQTIVTSGCGPTSAAMVVSSIKGTITPDTMADLYVKYGYRSNNNGTYFSAMKWTADVFNIDYEETYSLDKAVSLLRDNYYVIISCNEGLFTYGGHFIVAVGISGNDLKIYDPYLYNGKFTTSSRKGANVLVSENSAYLTVEKFRKYANATKFYCFKNDRTDIKENNIVTTVTDNSTSKIKDVSYKVKVTAKTGLNIRSGSSTNYKRIGGYTKGTTVTIVKETDDGWGKTNKGWICLEYTSKVVNSKIMTVVPKIGLNIRSGPGTNYKRIGTYAYNSRVTVLSISNNWAKTTNAGYVSLKYLK